MLASLGPVSFNLTTDLESIKSEESSNFVKHEVMGTSPVYEDTGDGDATVTLTGVLRPYLFNGALSGLAALRSARAAKLPLPLMRGDFMPLGWFLIDKISSEHKELHPMTGVGQEVEYTLSLISSGPPIGGQIGLLLRLF